MKPRTVADAVRLAERTGGITIEPLRYRKNPYTDACFEAAKLGLLLKARENAGRFIFYPLPARPTTTELDRAKT